MSIKLLFSILGLTVVTAASTTLSTVGAFEQGEVRSEAALRHEAECDLILLRSFREIAVAAGFRRIPAVIKSEPAIAEEAVIEEIEKIKK